MAVINSVCQHVLFESGLPDLCYCASPVMSEIGGGGVGVTSLAQAIDGYD
jgi:hypothetical protein